MNDINKCLNSFNTLQRTYNFNFLIKSRTFILITVLCLSNALFGQKETINTVPDSSKYNLGFQVTYITNSEMYFNDGALFATSFNLNFEKHLFQFGPLWWFDKNEPTNTFRGVIFSYQFFPLKTNRTLNFYFLYDLVYSFEKTSWESEMQFNPPHPSNELFHVYSSTRWNSLINQIGYGFRVNVFKGLYIDQNFSLGLEVYKYESENIVPADPSLSTTYRSSGHDTNMFLKLGIGYSWNK